MIIYLLVVVILVVKYLTILIYSMTFLKSKFHWKWLVVWGLFLFLISNVKFGEEQGRYYFNMNGAIGIFLIIFLLFYGSFLKKAFHFTFLAALLMCQNNIISLAISVNTSRSGAALPTDDLSSFMFMFFFISSFFLVLTLFLTRFKNSNDVVLTNNEYIMLSGIPILSFLVLAYSMISGNSLTFEVILNFAVLIINLITIFFSNNLVRKTQQINEYVYAEIQNDYYETRLSDIERIRTLQHDQKNTMLVVLHYLESGLMNDAKEALKELVLMPDVTYKRYTDNWVIDVVLMNKIAKMDAKGLTYKLEAQVPKNLDLSDKSIDLCAILGNILDNSIEEETRIHSRIPIKINIVFKEQKLIIQVSNETSQSDFLLESETPFSSKASGRRGIGINSIRMRTKKLGGYCDFSVQSNRFNVLIVIPLTNQKKG